MMAMKVDKSTKVEELCIFQMHSFHVLTSAYFRTASIV